MDTDTVGSAAGMACAGGPGLQLGKGVTYQGAALGTERPQQDSAL